MVARIQGFALGGGMELAMACHLRVASEKAKFGQPEINLGLIPGFGGTQRLLRLAGRGAALELCLTGAPIGAQRAYELGLVTRVVAPDALDEAVDALADQLAAAAPLAAAGILDAVLQGGETAIDQGLEFETQGFALAFCHRGHARRHHARSWKSARPSSRAAERSLRRGGLHAAPGDGLPDGSVMPAARTSFRRRSPAGPAGFPAAPADRWRTA